MKPLISIIVPIYNTERYLNRCVDSIINQTYKNIEIILINDGSTDNSPEICDEYAKKDVRIKVIHKENGGVSSARNYGIDKAQGAYIMFCDSDDFVEIEWCEEMVVSSKIIDNTILVCNYYEISDCLQKEVQKLKLPVSEDSNIPIKDFPLLGFGVFLGSVWNKIYLRSILVENKILFDKKMNYAEDLKFNLEYMKYMDKIKIILKPLYNYCFDKKESLTRTKGYKNMYEIQANLYNMIKNIMINSYNNFEIYECFFYNDYLNTMQFLLKNNFNNSTFKFYRKIKINSKIMKDKRFIRSTYYGDPQHYHLIYLKSLRSRNYLIVILFEKSWEFKKRIQECLDRRNC